MTYHLPFGTYGIRGNAHTPPFTPKYLKALARAIECLLFNKGLPFNILIGSDTRATSPRIKYELAAGFSQDTHTFDAGIIPTPGIIALMKKHSKFGCGIIITASHNPAHDNGIKIVLRHGEELQPSDIQSLQEFFGTNMSLPASPATLPTEYIVYTEAAHEYIIFLKKHFAPKFLAGLSIGLDCANGAVSAYAPALFEHFGARVIAINAAPDGKNINHECGSNEPNALRTLVLTNKLSCGFAFDGDGDRVVAVDAHGNLKDGDDLLFILASNPTRRPKGPVIGTTMSNSNLRKALIEKHVPFAASNVGELEVIKAMHANGSCLGGEPSGHIISREYLMCSDGIYAALATLNAALMTNNLALASFRHQPQVLKNVPVAHKIPLTTPLLEAIIDKYQALPDVSRIIVRYSGTEPLLRILLEADTLEIAATHAKMLALEMSTAITSIVSHISVEPPRIASL